MALSAQQLDALKLQLISLLEFDEPMAVLVTLRRVAERKAHSVTRGHITFEAAERWSLLANALHRVENVIGEENRRSASA